MLGIAVGVGTIAAGAPVAVAALSSAPAPLTTPAGTRAVSVTPTSGNFVDSAGQIVGGWKELTLPAASQDSASNAESGGTVTPDTEVSVGGGTWIYGDYTSGDRDTKYCYSEYLNFSDKHSATAEMNPAKTAKDIEPANIWAFAETSYYASYAGVCTVYWDNL